MKIFLLVFLLLISNGVGGPGFAREVLKNSPSPVPKVITVDPPQDLEVCFSPEMPCNKKLAALIRTTKTSLDIAIFDITDSVISDAIKEVNSRKLQKPQIRMIVDQRQAKGTKSVAQNLKLSGISVRCITHMGNGYMHNKFTLVDDKMLETGSFNYTRHASESNQENQIYLANSTIVSTYKKRFESLWKKTDECKFKQPTP